MILKINVITAIINKCYIFFWTVEMLYLRTNVKSMKELYAVNLFNIIIKVNHFCGNAFNTNNAEELVRALLIYGNLRPFQRYRY